MKRIMLLGAVALALQACTWVTLTPEGENTRILSAAEVTNCHKLGVSTSTLKATVAGFERSEKRIREELELLARNAAVDLKGDTVVPITEPVHGRQTFEVYRCGNP